VRKDLRTNFWKTARDPLSPLVAPTSASFGRLGALVFQPDATEKSYWADALLSIQTRIAGSAAGFTAVLTRGRKNVLPTRWQVAGKSGTNSKPRRDSNVSFAPWDKVESYQPKKTRLARGQPWLSTLNFDNHGAQVALPQSPILRGCDRLLTKIKEREK
jgi:hypothetical protein